MEQKQRLAELIQACPQQFKTFLHDQKEAGPRQVSEKFNYSFFCPFCLQITSWTNFGSYSECSLCHVMGSDAKRNCQSCLKACEDDIDKEIQKCFLFNMMYMLPQFENGELLALEDQADQVYRCFKCCFDQQVFTGFNQSEKSSDMPFRYIYVPEVCEPSTSDESYCNSCQSRTQWLTFYQRHQTYDRVSK